MATKNEDYREDPGKNLRETLRACGWTYSTTRGKWFKGLWAIELDNTGIFLFQFHGGRWDRTHGLSWSLVKTRDLAELQIWFTDGYKLDLLRGY